MFHLPSTFPLPLADGTGTWRSATVYEHHNGKLYRTLAGGSAAYSLARTTADRHAGPPLKVTAPHLPRGKANVYLDERLHALQGRRPGAPKVSEPLLTDESGPWYTAAQLSRLYPERVRGKVRGKGWCHDWHKKGRLRRKPVRTPAPHGPDEVFVYCGADVDAILADRRPRARELLDKTACKVLRSILKDGPVSSDEVIRRAKAAGIHRGAVYRARDALGVHTYPPDGCESGPGVRWLWALRAPKSKGRPTPRQQAATWLKAELSGFPLLGADVRARAEEAGIRPAHLKHARQELKVSRHQTPGGLYWCLPGQEAPRVPNPDAAAFLRDFLAAGAVPAKEVQADGEAAGYSRCLLCRTAKVLGVTIQRASGSRTSPYLWSFPASAAAAGHTGTRPMPGAARDNGSVPEPPLSDIAPPFIREAEKERQADLIGQATLRHLEPKFDELKEAMAQRAGAPVTSDIVRSCRGITVTVDCRSMCWGTQEYTFTDKQAAAVRVLFEARQSNVPHLSQLTILDRANSTTIEASDGTNPPRLRDLFRGHPAWGAVIVSSSRGTYRLADPPAN